MRRDGNDVSIPSTDLVPGDVVLLAEGDFIPADLRLINCNRFEVQESILTGEATSVQKTSKVIRIDTRRLHLSQCRGNAFMGTMVTRGTATGIVVRTGSNTEIGKIGAALVEDPILLAPSPLHRRMGYLGRALVGAAVILCLLVFGIGLLQKRSMSNMARLSISLAVSVIPEGLVSILTVTMALAVRRLAKKQVIVRRLNAVETLGAISVIAVDKTGTITKGKMHLEQLWTLSSETEALAMEICVICNNATLDGLGDPTEVALIEGIEGKDPEAFARIRSSWRRLAEFPFDSERKMMSVLASRVENASPPNNQLFVKGASESVLARCTRTSREGLDEDLMKLISEKENEMSDLGLRVLSLACKDIESRFEEMAGKIEETGSFANFEDDLTFIGLVGLMDPAKEGVSQSVALCQDAGIKVCMITGDNLRTALSIAQTVGIYDPKDRNRAKFMRGPDLDLLNMEAISNLRPFPSVFARVSPSNKMTIVKALQAMKETVSMTGDGVNDAPAVRQADAGAAMGKGGTQITREAAALILLEDNFSVLLDAIAQGRQIYHNVARFIVYLLSCNSAEIWTVLGAMALGWESPLTPIGILWANIIADIPPSMALAMEWDGQERLMSDTPDTVKAIVLGPNTWTLITVNGLVLSALTLLVYGVIESQLSVEQRRSQAFLVLIGLQLLLAFISRSTRLNVFQIGILGNIWLIGAIFTSFVCLVLGIYVPLLYRLLELEPVVWTGWAKFGISALIMLICNEVAKFGIRSLLESK